jgi:hypothetical protein
MSNLVDHARRELEIIGEDEDITDGILKMVQIFSDMDHSGASAFHTIGVLNQLLQFRNLAPLTDDPSEWMHISEQMWGGEGGIWQNTRNAEAFSNDGGKTYYLLSEGGNDQHREPLHTSKHKE